MSLFDENKIQDSPITAQLLRDILSERQVDRDDEDIIRYNKILQHILNRVRYNIEKDIWEYRTSLAVIGVQAPFTDEYTDSINKMIRNGDSVNDICDWVNKHPIKLSTQLLNFVVYFKKRGFLIYFRTGDYLKTATDRAHAKVITISWKKEGD